MRTSEDDSLEVYFERANNDSLPFQVRHDFAKKAENIVAKRPNDSMNRVNMFRVANRYWNMNELEHYKSNIFEIINQCKTHDSLSLIKSYIYLSDYYTKTGKYDSSYSYINVAEKILSKFDNKVLESKNLISKINMQYESGDYIGCERTALTVLQSSRYINDLNLKYEMYNVLGLIYNLMKDHEKSIFYHKKALNLSSSMSLDHMQAQTLNNLGYTYNSLEKYALAKQNFKNALKISDLYSKNPILYAVIIDNLAYANFKTKDFKNLPDLFYISLKIRDSLKVLPGIISSNLNLSEYYALKKDTLKAISYAKKAYTIAKKNFLSKDLLLCIDQLSKVDNSNVNNLIRDYINTNDSIQLAERKNSNKFARIEYETEELTLENDKLTDQRKTILYTASCLLLLLLSTFLFWYQKSKSRELQFVKARQEANEEIYKLMIDQHQKLEEGKQFEKARIAKELHDGIMGRLSSIRLNLFVLEKKNDESTIAKCIEHVHEIQEVEKEIKSIAYDLGNNLFSENISFETMVRKLFAAIENHSDIAFTLVIDPNLDWELLDNNTKIQIYRIFQEALQNIDKYAHAKNVRISIYKPENTIEIEIADDGVGFEKKKVKKGFGLKNMKARAKEIEGKISVRSEKGKGTSIFLVVPSKV